MRIEKDKYGDYNIFVHDAIVTCGACDWFEIYMINIDSDRIELSDISHFAVGQICLEDKKDVIDIIEHGKSGIEGPVSLYGAIEEWEAKNVQDNNE